MTSEEKRVQRAAFQSMTFKEKLGYFWDYYKLHTFIIIILVLFFSSIIHAVVTKPPDPAFYAVMINADLNKDYDSFGSEFAKYAQIDTKENSVVMDTSIYTASSDLASMADLAASQKMMTLASVGSIDVIAGNESIVAYFADGGYFLDLRTVLPPAYIEKYEDSFYYYTFDEEAKKAEAEERGVTYDSDAKGPYNTTEPVPIGIRQTAFSNLPTGSYTEETILGICTSSTHTDMALKFLDFLQ